MRNLLLHVQQASRPWHSSWSISAPPEQSRLIRSLVISPTDTSFPAITTSAPLFHQQLSLAPPILPPQSPQDKDRTKQQKMVTELLSASSLGCSHTVIPVKQLSTSSQSMPQHLPFQGTSALFQPFLFSPPSCLAVSWHRRKSEEYSNQSLQYIFETEYFKVIMLQCSLLPPREIFVSVG